MVKIRLHSPYPFLFRVFFVCNYYVYQFFISHPFRIIFSSVDINVVQEKADEALRKQSEIVAKGKNIAIEKEKMEMITIEALQTLKAAKLSLIEFKRDIIDDILEMETPPTGAEVIAECFFILKGSRDVSWKNVRAAMLEEDYFKHLSDINCDLISLKQLSQCKSHLKVSQNE